MQNRLSKFAGVILATLVVVSLLAAIPAFAVPIPNIHLVPSHNAFDTDTASPGDQFNVSAWVDDVSDLMGWQIALYYNHSVINCTKATALFVLSPGMPLGPAYDYFDSWGVAFVGSTGMTGATPGNGDIELARFTFNITASPPKWGNKTSDLVISYKPTGGAYECKLKDSLGGAISFTATDGDYIYSWKYPALPYLTVNPATVTKDQFTNWTGTTFSIDIVLNELSTAWELVSVSLNKTYNSTLLQVMGVTEGAFIKGFGSTTFVTATYSSSVFINCSLNTPYPSVFPYGTGVIATITFKIIFQGDYGDNRVCDLGFLNIALLDKDGVTIPDDANKRKSCTYTIEGFLSKPPAWLEVEDVTVGPNPMQNLLVNVNVWIKNVDARWQMVAPQFRLTYDNETVEVVAITNGSFMSTFGPTLPMSADFPSGNGDGWHPTHVLYAELLLPPYTGIWPEGEGIIATITFKIKKQYMAPNDIIMHLDFIQIKFKDSAGKQLPPVDWVHVKNGTLTILGWSLEGRVIDVYTQYPAPYGGQGPMNPSDMFWPQKEVWLYANVTYNWWPVQQKDVTFEIRDPSDHLWTVLVGTTNDVGVAQVSFRIPWPCDDPASLFGVWTVIASVDIACVIVKDRLWFHFDYLVHLVEVTTDKAPPEYYKHCEWITITVIMYTHAQQIYPLTLVAVIQDELNVPIGYADISCMVGGTVFCQPKYYYWVCEIHVPKFAFAGVATIHVNALSALPSECGSAYCPEVTTTVNIYPGWVP